MASKHIEDVLINIDGNFIGQWSMIMVQLALMAIAHSSAERGQYPLSY